MEGVEPREGRRKGGGGYIYKFWIYPGPPLDDWHIFGLRGDALRVDDLRGYGVRGDGLRGGIGRLDLKLFRNRSGCRSDPQSRGCDGSSSARGSGPRGR